MPWATANATSWPTTTSRGPRIVGPVRTRPATANPADPTGGWGTLEDEGELSSSRNGINELFKPGEVFNGSLVFEVPASAATLVLRAGVVEGSADGYSTA